ncbi:MAG: hypothetical protein IVW53_16110 [Chloroflexi bacterium]|nr:hypothetical protein [Chloroflexota bacterium]
MRDELILRALADGATRTVEVAARSGLPRETVRRGLLHLIKAGHVYSPEYSSYHLSALGQTVADGLRSTAGQPAARRPARPPQPARQADDGLSHVIGPGSQAGSGSKVTTPTSAATTPVAPQSSPARSSTAARPPFVVGGVLVPDDGFSHVIDGSLPLPTSAPRAIATTDVVTTSVARPASRPRSSTAAPRPAPIGTAPSVDRLVDDRTAHDDAETTIAADAGTIDLGTVAAGALVIGAVGLAVWKGPAIAAALGTAGTAQRDEAPRQAAVIPGLDARRGAKGL